MTRMMIAGGIVGCVGCADVAPDPELLEEAALASSLRVLSDSDLGEVFGCWDMEIVAASPQDRVMLWVRLGGELGEQAVRAGAEDSGVLTLPHPDAVVEVRWGESVSADSCTDALSGTPVIDGVAAAAGGTLAYTIRPDLNVPLPPQAPYWFSADVDLDLDLQFADPVTGQLRPLELQLEGVNVGNMGH